MCDDGISDAKHMSTQDYVQIVLGDNKWVNG